MVPSFIDVQLFNRCIYIYIYIYYILVGGLEHEFHFSIYWECHHPNWRTHIFQRGRLNHQPVYQPISFLDFCGGTHKHPTGSWWNTPAAASTTWPSSCPEHEPGLPTLPRCRDGGFPMVTGGMLIDPIVSPCPMPRNSHEKSLFVDGYVQMILTASHGLTTAVRFCTRLS